MEIILINDDAIKPTRAFKESASLDLYFSIDVDIEVGSIVIVIIMILLIVILIFRCQIVM